MHLPASFGYVSGAIQQLTGDHIYGCIINFGLQLVLSLVVYALIAKWYVSPWLAEKQINQALMLLIFPGSLNMAISS
jgi:vacuolar-type H+-ATPase subunit I/STV1